MVANRIGGREGTMNAVRYNGRRITVYILIGILFGLLGQAAVVNGLQKWLSVGLGIGIILLSISYLIKPQINNYITMNLGFAFNLLSRLNKHSNRHAFLKASLLGLVNGFLPCGLVYMAVAGAIIQASLIDSAIFMAVFGLGTLPMMLTLSISGNALFSLIKGNYKRILTACMFCFGIFLVYRGFGMEFTGALDNLINSKVGVVVCE
jgi:sulfite exporter TauE/SafE